MAPAEGTEDTKELNVAAQTLGGSDGSDGGASDDKEDEEETKFVEWDPSGRFGRVREISAAPFFFSSCFPHICACGPFLRGAGARVARNFARPTNVSRQKPECRTSQTLGRLTFSLWGFATRTNPTNRD